MPTLIFTEQLDKHFSKIKDRNHRQEIGRKLEELKERAPLGKKLSGSPYWSIHVNRFRIIYELHGDRVLVIDIFLRKHDYRELRNL